MDGKHFSAFNMTSGHFGGRHGDESRELIMVQSMDGKLQIFEQSAEAFTVQLVDCLVPGPLLYLDRVDAFVTGSYACRAECYKYQVLASAQQYGAAADVGGANANGGGTTIMGLSAVKAAMVDWTHNLGEPIKALVSGRFSRKAAKSKDDKGGEVMAMCDRSIFLIKENGGIVQQKRLDRGSPPMCCHAHIASGNQSVFVVGYEDGLIQVLVDFVVAWAAKLDTGAPPVEVSIGEFGGQAGLLVVIDQVGRLSVGYLGTTVPRAHLADESDARVDNGAGAGGGRDLDYDAMEKEHRDLLHSIRQAQTEQREQPREKLLMRTQLGHSIDRSTVAGGTGGIKNGVPASLLRGDGNGNANGDGSGDSKRGDESGMNLIASSEGSRALLKTSARLYVSYTGTTPIQNVTVTVDPPPGLTATPTQVNLRIFAPKPPLYVRSPQPNPMFFSHSHSRCDEGGAVVPWCLRP
jgi:Bardet-Biedl syndrome 9 protein